MTDVTFIDHVSDPMLALDGAVVREANAPACDLFDIAESFEGNELSTLLSTDESLAESYSMARTHYRDVAGIVEGDRRHFDRDHPAIERLLDGRDPESADPDIGILVDGSLEYFHLSTSSLGDAPVDSDRLLTFRKITHLKRRERDLDFLMQVVSRVLRHNLRNDLSVARGYATTIEERTDGPTTEMAAKIRDTCADLVETSEKARRIQQAITADKRVEFDLGRIVDRAASTVADETTPDVDITVDVPDVEVHANPELLRALEACIENAVVYNDSETPWVEITADCTGRWVTLEVTDNGPGIPQTELDALRERGETDLLHGSGAGLWLTHTVVEKSGGEITYESGSDGTTVQMGLPLADQ